MTATAPLPELLCQRLDQAISGDQLRFARRLLHGRGGALAGCEDVTVDSYFPLLAVTHFQSAPGWVPALVARFEAQLRPYGFTHLALQDRSGPRPVWDFLLGEPLESLTVALAEGPRIGLTFQAQNIGLFNDAAGLRQWLAQHAGGQRLLNLFAYTGALSLAALAGGAAAVVNVDMSKSALARARTNHLLNGWQSPRVQYLPFNVLTSAGRIHRAGPFDLIVADPPTAQPGSFVAARDYTKLARRLPQWLAPGGRVVACLNAPELDSSWLAATVGEHLPDYRAQRLAPALWVDERDGERGLKVLVFEPVSC